MAKVRSRTEKRAAGATKPSEVDTKGLIFQYAWWMKKQGYAESTITERVRRLKRLVKLGADLFDPESVKEVIAKKESWNANTKITFVDAYTSFLKSAGGMWEPPIYKEVRKLPFIPTEAEIDQLIASCGRKTAAFLQLLKETAMRAGEAYGLRWVDVDPERRTIRVTPEKGSNPRIFKVSSKLIAMLEALPRGGRKVFGETTLGGIRATFCESRKKATRKLQNPRLLEIHFHTFRHWKATMLYHQTKDILYVMNFLGHKSVKNTMLYIQLEQAIFKEGSDEFTCKVANDSEEAKVLVEAGFDYVCTTPEGVMLFRKRK